MTTGVRNALRGLKIFKHRYTLGVFHGAGSDTDRMLLLKNFNSNALQVKA